MFKETPRLVRVESAEEKEERELLERRDALYAELIEKLPSVKEALMLLDGLPEGLVYHTKAHTEDVIKETILFALADGISDGAIEQQVIAAAWHDMGYLEQDKANEPIGVRLFQNSVTSTELKLEVREEIASNINDTAIVLDNEKKPHLHMERSAIGYMLDADVSNFGREDFFVCMEKIAKETGVNLENRESRANFYAFVITLLKNHDWHTEGARRLRQRQKDKNLDKLMAEYESLRPRAEEKYRLRRAA